MSEHADPTPKPTPLSAKAKTAPPGAYLQKLLYDYDEAAWSLGMSKRNLYRFVSEGRIPILK